MCDSIHVMIVSVLPRIRYNKSSDNDGKTFASKLFGENFREFPENVGKIPDGKIFGENFREIPGNSGKFRENSRRENFRGNFRGKFRENLFSRPPNLQKSRKSGKHAL